MKKYLSLLLVLLCIICAFTGCKSKDSDESVSNEAHMNVITGKVIQIKDDNTVLIEILKDTDGDVTIGNKIMVKYDKIDVYNTNDSMHTNICEDYKAQINDELNFRFSKIDVKQKDGYDYIETEKIYKYADTPVKTTSTTTTK